MIRPTPVDIIERAYITGPILASKEWDTKIVPETTARIRKDRLPDLKFDPNLIIPSDDKLADELFQAGFELAVELGVLCTATERLIKISEEELKDAIRTTHDEFYVGQEADLVHVVQRKPEDAKPVIYIGGPAANPGTEEMYIPITESICRDRRVDILIPLCLATVYGRPIKSGTPFETLSGLLESTLNFEAMRRAGRPHMPKHVVASDVTGIAQLPAFSHGYSKSYDIPVLAMIAELKLGTPGLNRMIHSQECGYVTFAYCHPMLGGYAGGPEETALLAVAAELLEVAVNFGNYVESTVTDIWFLGNTGRKASWAHSLVIQAITRNTPVIFSGEISSVMDTGYPELFYETAASALMNTVSGAGTMFGIRSGAGRFPDHNTPLENDIAVEVIKSVAPGMKREQANELVLEILPLYENLLKKAPQGKSFPELMDLKTLMPKKDWLDIYMKARKKLIDLGLELAD